MQTGKKSERKNMIEENLKRVFNETLDEGIPDRFTELLNQLKEQDSEQDSRK